MLETGGPYTVFAPTNAGFTGVNLQGLTADQAKALLQDYMVNGNLTTAQIKALVPTPGSTATLTTVSGKMLTVVNDNGVVKVGGTPLGDANLAASNGNVIPVSQPVAPTAPPAAGTE